MEKPESKIRYEFNPYTYTRISAMKSLLLKKEDYDKILKRDPNEIVKLLQEGVYSEEINSLAMKFSGIKLVEKALNMHLIKIFTKLKRISDDETKKLMNQYLKRYDFWNLKTILRAKLTDVKEQDLLDMLMPVGTLSMEKLKDIIKKDDVMDIIESSGLVNPKEFKDAVQNFKNTDNLSVIEDLLSYHYYLDSIGFTKSIPEQGKLFREFFSYEIDVYNIKIILKKIYFKLKKNDVKKYLIDGGKISLSKMTRFLDVDDFKEIGDMLKKTLYRDALNSNILGDDPLLSYELQLDNFLYQRSSLLYHQHPLSVDVVLGYMFTKEIEVRNLIAIFKSKVFDFGQDTVKDMIVINR